jgi:hypothetical protein
MAFGSQMLYSFHSSLKQMSHGSSKRCQQTQASMNGSSIAGIDLPI